VFGRSKTETAPEPESAEAKPQGKGRPTPKRKDAEAARKSKVVLPKDKKQAKVRLREERAKQRKVTNDALRSGDERHYPARDQGKGRHLARNWIDGRRNVGELFWPLVITALAFLVIPISELQALSTVLLLGFYVLVMTDTAWSLFGLRKALSIHVPDLSERRGALPYAFGRSLQSRKRRLPVAQVERGWTKRFRSGEAKPF
jgi:hypothetical protein